MTSITVRIDADAQDALEQLTSHMGLSKSEAVRLALLNEARRQRRELLRAEAKELNDDVEDRAEMQRVMQEMERLRAW